MPRPFLVEVLFCVVVFFVMREDFGKQIPQKIAPQNQEGLENRARDFWESRLKDEVRIATPQNPRCIFSIVIPVSNEKSERIIKQIESLRSQRGIDSSEFEIIYIINNDTPDNSARSKQIVAANQETLSVIRGLAIPNVFAVDKSSQGHEISACTVGSARNRRGEFAISRNRKERLHRTNRRRLLF